jgi:hypothetical protein
LLKKEILKGDGKSKNLFEFMNLLGKNLTTGHRVDTEQNFKLLEKLSFFNVVGRVASSGNTHLYKFTDDGRKFYLKALHYASQEIEEIKE